MMRTASKKQTQKWLDVSRENDDQEALSLPSLVWRFLIFQLGFRQQMLVEEIMIYSDGASYYLCPRCHAAMDREFVNFCDRCGQHLSWKNNKNAKKIYPAQHNDFHS